ncbi:hypothetical protein [Methyloceanibacter sp.]|uniref:hypothetical protein n=1 Tax=Methyloceanibacter sp. TaxID=1965321 RepID=UPI002D28C11C|nr:hypothetical protein [Methyloceanibacter sp.]HZP09302.1 hypothetical protein [Methyloceanibacter sp.]
MMELRQKFDPLELEIVERVYEAASAYLEARNLYADEKTAAEDEDALRHIVFALAGRDAIEFDTLCDKVVAALDEYRLWAKRVRVRDEPVVIPFPTVDEAA